MPVKDKYDFFISCAHTDRTWVNDYLCSTLRAAGGRIIAEETFTPGVPLVSEFERAIRSSRYTVLVLSPAYMDDHVNAFVDLLAAAHGLDTSTWPVIPLILKPVELPLFLK